MRLAKPPPKLKSATMEEGRKKKMMGIIECAIYTYLYGLSQVRSNNRLGQVKSNMGWLNNRLILVS